MSSLEGVTLSMAQVAKLANVSRQAIYKSIKSKRLKAVMRGYRYYIKIEDFREYQWSRRDILFKEIDGELIYEMGEGRVSPNQAAILIGVNKNRIYYLLKSNKLKYKKVGSLYVIQLTDLQELSVKMGVNMNNISENKS